MLKSQPLKQELKLDLPLLTPDSLINYAYDHRVELAISKEKETQAQLNLNVVQTKNYPVLSAFASGGFKNGYITSLEASSLNKLWGNYVIGVGLKVPIFDSNRHKYNVDQAKSNITSVSYDTEIARRNISNQVTESNVNCIAAKKKIDQYNLQLAQAQEAYQLAQVNFKSGAITNLDLLDSETAVAESQLLLLKSRIDYIVNSYNLKIALGDKL
jgi:outer membrane protein TolC